MGRPGARLTWRGSISRTWKPRVSQSAHTGIPETPVDAIATVVMPQSRGQPARASRAAGQVPKRRTGWGTRSGGTATQCSASPRSMPAAWGLKTWSGPVRAGSGNREERQDSRGGGRDGTTCRLPHGIRTGPVTRDAVADSRDQPHQRAQSPKAGTVTTTHGRPTRITRHARAGPVPSVCEAAQPPKPLTKRCT